MLPSDVWSHVTSFLSVKDVARLSGKKFDIVSCSARSATIKNSLCHLDSREDGDLSERLLLLQESAGRHLGLTLRTHILSLK